MEDQKAKSENMKYQGDIDYIAVLDYLNDNQEVPYSDPNADGILPDEKVRLEEVKKKGQKAVGEIKKMADVCAKVYQLDKCLPISWLDGSNTKTRNYLWAQMKYKNFANDPTSISIFVEKNGETGCRYRISLELKNEGTDKKTVDRYHSYLDEPIDFKTGLVLVSGSNEKDNPVVINESPETVKSKIASGSYKKVQLCKYIERKPDETNKYFHEELMEAVGLLIPYYEHVVNKQPPSNKHTWLMAWNPEVWEWQHYPIWCEQTKNGETHTESWTCSSKKPAIGDDVFLIKTGAKPRGIIAHGTIGKEYYEAPHYDKEKDAQGITAGHVDVVFDRILDYNHDEFLLQETLKEYFPQQSWSPRQSGTEIQEDVFPDLWDRWKALIQDGEKEKMRKYGLNTILYGPPGTGKTYNTVRIAVSICEPDLDVDKMEYKDVLEKYNELKKEGRIEFTTFHQSYGYEEFIEGIKPVMESETVNPTKDIQYKVMPGLFKAFCENARKFGVEKTNPKVWCLLLDGTGESDLKTYCFENNEIRIGWPQLPERITNATGSDEKKKSIIYFQDEMKIGDLVVIQKIYDRIDAIGVIDGNYEYDNTALGGEWPRKRNVKWIAKGIDEDILELNEGTQLDRNTVYPLRRVKADDVIKIANKYSKTEPYVFIIDEINRGNISKIFGELITLIEPTKRVGASEAMETTLPYSGDLFSVPDNVYILGTMNTADRSIALMDTALRRRFDFKEMMPNLSVVEGITVSADGETLNVKDMLSAINERIEYLYDREHTIGHAFFTRLRDNNSMACLADIFKNNVVPLLQEYFYEDYEKIQFVLGDNDKSNNDYKFVLDKEVHENDIFKKSPQLDLHEKTYEIQKDAFKNILSYIEITKSRKAEG